MKQPDNLQAVVALQPDFLGFIFYDKSPRNMQQSLLPEDLLQIPEGIKKVGVFVNAAADEILKQTKKFSLDAVQLHGNESPALCRELCQQGLEVIKVFRVGDSLNLADLQPFVQVVDYFLFDTQGKQYGGNGQVFDWQLLKNYSFPVPIILSGGITVASLATLSQLQHLPIYAIDVNSRFETAPGLKSTAALKKLFQHPIFSGQSIQS